MFLLVYCQFVGKKPVCKFLKSHPNASFLCCFFTYFSQEWWNISQTYSYLLKISIQYRTSSSKFLKIVYKPNYEYLATFSLFLGKALDFFFQTKHFPILLIQIGVLIFLYLTADFPLINSQNHILVLFLHSLLFFFLVFRSCTKF